MKTASIRGTARVVPLFVCSKCRQDAPGDGHVTVEFYGIDNLRRRIDSVEAPRGLIPVGWSSNGVAGVTCPNCN